MTWEETIRLVRTDRQYQDLVKFAYLEEQLELNVTRFLQSEEWNETQTIINKFKPSARNILDVGCGNGFTSIALALTGFDVTSLEPDPSDTVGIGAIKKLRSHYHLNNLAIVQGSAELATLDSNYFDVIYCRQAMHHAAELNAFVKNLSRFLVKGGIFFTVRDHVVFNERDKKRFLKNHPLQKFYGGENAFSPKEYQYAFQHAGLEIMTEYKYFESVLNYYPLTKEEVSKLGVAEQVTIKKKLEQKLGWLGKSTMAYWMYKKIIFDPLKMLDENNVAGRMYSYLARKA